MKTLKFRDYLVSKILDGSKTSTWRLFDDKDLRVGDQLSLISAETMGEFAKARVISVTKKLLGDVQDSDFEDGHERYKDKRDILEHYKEYYGDKVGLDSVLKIVKFELIP